MMLRLTNFVYLLFLVPLWTNEVICNSNVAKDLKTMVSEIIPLRLDGKIEIPVHIKHIKLDIGLSYSAPMSQYWR